MTSVAQTAEADAADQLATFFDVSLDLLCIRDTNRRFNRVNRTWERVLGYPPEMLEGMEILRLIHPDDVADTLATMKRMESEDEVLGFVNRYRHRDGSYRHLEWRAKRVGDKVYGAARDVTERLAMEAEVAAATQSKDAFLANVSHEMRTPLNGVVGLVDALAETELSERQHEMVRLIQSSAVTLERLVSDLLDVAKLESGSMTLEQRVFGLRDLEAVLETHRHNALEKGLGFTVEQQVGDLRHLRGDVTRIKQVLGNLLANAVKFTPKGGVTVRMQVAPPGADDLAMLSLEVEDTGVGFEPRFQDALFTRFSQADTTIRRRFGGTGLGLAISKSLVEMMGGEIAATSQPGVGSSFKVRLPLPPAPARAVAPAVRIVEQLAVLTAGRENPLKVLLAEDHPVNRRLVEIVLDNPAIALTVVENGERAVAAFADQGPFDLVLMDMEMPVMDGLAAVRAIRAREAGAARTPIAMLSANAHDHHQQATREAGADVHIAKPVTPVGLLGGMQAAIAAAIKTPA